MHFRVTLRIFRMLSCTNLRHVLHIDVGQDLLALLLAPSCSSLPPRLVSEGSFKRASSAFPGDSRGESTDGGQSKALGMVDAVNFWGL